LQDGYASPDSVTDLNAASPSSDLSASTVYADGSSDTAAVASLEDDFEDLLQLRSRHAAAPSEQPGGTLAELPFVEQGDRAPAAEAGSDISLTEESRVTILAKMKNFSLDYVPDWAMQVHLQRVCLHVPSSG
jgi:hypothetical protein